MYARARPPMLSRMTKILPLTPSPPWLLRTRNMMSLVKMELRVSNCESMVDMRAARPQAITRADMPSPETRVMTIGRMRSASLPTRAGNDRRPITPTAMGRKNTTVQTSG